MSEQKPADKPVSNSQQNDVILEECVREYLGLKDQRAAITKSMTKVKNRAKAECGIPHGAFTRAVAIIEEEGRDDGKGYEAIVSFRQDLHQVIAAHNATLAAKLASESWDKIPSTVAV